MKTCNLQLAQLLVIVTVCTCEPFKIPVKVIRPWRELQLHSEEKDTAEINSISSAPGRAVKFPNESEVTNYDKKESGVTESEYSPFPSGSNSKAGEPVFEPLRYEDARPALERFYKHQIKSQTNSAERIVFPSEIVDGAEKTEGAKNSEEVLKLGFGSQEETSSVPDTGNFNEYVNASDSEESYKQSLESLAQFVRHLLFRGGLNRPENLTTPEPVQSSTELDVREQSLYTGPRLKPFGSSAESSDDCPEGFKKTRNGFCQKPSRRLGTG